MRSAPISCHMFMFDTSPIKIFSELRLKQKALIYQGFFCGDIQPQSYGVDNRIRTDGLQGHNLTR